MTPPAPDAPQHPSQDPTPTSSPSRPSGGGPTVLRIMLGGQLRKLRERCGISREDAGEAIRGSHAKISRLELGRVGFKERDVSDLLALYGVTDPADRGPLLALARRANEPGWWQRYTDLLPPWFETYVGLEQAATQIRTYEPQFVPGLLQTEAMARAVTRLGHTAMSDEEEERRVELRRRRQQVLEGPNPPMLWAVIDEAALRRPLGGATVMVEQIEYLLDASERSSMVLQVVPFRVGGHAGAGGPFSVLRFADESSVGDVVYLEQLASATYLEKRAEVDAYLATMELLSVQADDPAATQTFLSGVLADLRGR